MGSSCKLFYFTLTLDFPVSNSCPSMELGLDLDWILMSLCWFWSELSNGLSFFLRYVSLTVIEGWLAENLNLFWNSISSCSRRLSGDPSPWLLISDTWLSYPTWSGEESISGRRIWVLCFYSEAPNFSLFDCKVNYLFKSLLLLLPEFFSKISVSFKPRCLLLGFLPI